MTGQHPPNECRKRLAHRLRHALSLFLSVYTVRKGLFNGSLPLGSAHCSSVNRLFPNGNRATHHQEWSVFRLSHQASQLLLEYFGTAFLGYLLAWVGVKSRRYSYQPRTSHHVSVYVRIFRIGHGTASYGDAFRKGVQR